MPAEVRWTDRARESLLAIYVFIGRQNEAAAERFYDRIERRAAQLSRMPRLGPRRPDLGETARLLVEGRYLLLYETDPNEDDGDVLFVDVIDLVDGRRDL